MANQATVFDPVTGARKVVNVGDPTAFAGGYVLETDTDNYQKRFMAGPNAVQTGALNKPLYPPSTPTPIPPKASSAPFNPASVAPAPTGNYGLTMEQANDPSHWQNGKFVPPAGVAQNTPAPTPIQGSQGAFQAAFGQLMAKGKQSQELQDQKNKLLQQLYDRPLTPEELRTLSPAQQESIKNGDRKLLEFQVMHINDMIQGRADENTTALNYMMDGYKLDQTALEKKKEAAFKSFSTMFEKYPDILSVMSPEGFAAVQQGEMPDPLDLQRVYSAYKKVDKTAGTPTASIQEYEYYKKQEIAAGRTPISYNEYQNMDANRKALANKINNSGLDYRTQSQVDALSKGFDGNQIVKDYSDVQGKKLDIDRLLSGDQSGPGDMAAIFYFMKSLDPSSVVRESEYASAASSGNIFTGAYARFNGLFNPKGGRLSPQVKEDFKAVMNKAYLTKEQQYTNLYNETARKINNKTGATDGNSYLTQYNFTASPDSGTTSGPALTTEQQSTYNTLRNDPTYSDLTDDEIRSAMGFKKEGSVSSNAIGSTLKPVTINNKMIRVTPDMGTKLAQADAEMFKATGKHIIINEAYRSYANQKIAYDKYKAGTGGRAAPPGQSFHGKGQAVDVANWKEAETYLRKYGLKNNLADDKNHFSLGEFS